MYKEVGGGVYGVYGELYVDGRVGVWGVCILILIFFDFDDYLG